MGLLDVLNGMQNGPRGPSTPSSEQSSGGMSPMTMAILGLLAWKAFKHITAGQPGAAPQSAPTPVPPPANAGPGGSLGSALGGGGGLGDVLKGGLGGLLAGGAAGSVLSGGLGDLLNQLQQGGHGETASTWVGKGENKAISPGDLANALGADQIQSLSAQSGLSRDDLLSGLSQYLPQVVDHLTPDGRLPTENEISGRI
ncbi:YidB family protein [Bradyrhizobium sp. CIAT3101]|uniref:YidB family protein n=1 Tax=Bradyrhizobium sp. CIAT3101 TaxID=439387 RepID=UPI0024B0E4F2|nr:YidB family protein [Bradyrhizobium sp. CIAT3101]WFU80836.1 YidB family protein [Bradyrhizobium sp. CIAT3101]